MRAMFDDPRTTPDVLTSLRDKGGEDDLVETSGGGGGGGGEGEEGGPGPP